MKWEARVYVRLKKGVLDPQGVTVGHALEALGYDNVQDVRVGKFILLSVSNSSEDEVRKQVEEMCERLLTNPVIEEYSYDLVSLGDGGEM